MNPTPVTLEQLLDFASGSLKGPAAQTVEQFIVTNAEAARTVAMYRQASRVFRTDDSVSPTAAAIDRATKLFEVLSPAREGWLSIVDRLVARLVFDSHVTPMAVRSTDNSDHRQWTFEAEGLGIDIQADRKTAPGHRDAWQITGQLSGAPANDEMPIAIFAVDPRQLLSETQTDNYGMFRFNAPSGRYQVLLRTQTSVVEIPDLVMQ